MAKHKISTLLQRGVTEKQLTFLLAEDYLYHYIGDRPGIVRTSKPPSTWRVEARACWPQPHKS